MKIERTPTGKIELRLSDDPEQFKRLAEVVRRKLKGRWTEQLDELDRSYWDLEVGGKKITVHREHFLGVSVCCDDDAALRALLEGIQREFETVPRK